MAGLDTKKKKKNRDSYPFYLPVFKKFCALSFPNDTCVNPL